MSYVFVLENSLSVNNRGTKGINKIIRITEMARIKEIK